LGGGTSFLTALRLPEGKVGEGRQLRIIEAGAIEKIGGEQAKGREGREEEIQVIWVEHWARARRVTHRVCRPRFANSVGRVPLREF